MGDDDKPFRWSTFNSRATASHSWPSAISMSVRKHSEGSETQRRFGNTANFWPQTTETILAMRRCESRASQDLGEWRDRRAPACRRHPDRPACNGPRRDWPHHRRSVGGQRLRVDPFAEQHGRRSELSHRSSNNARPIVAARNASFGVLDSNNVNGK